MGRSAILACMSGFMIPGCAAPNNLHYGSNVKASLVESDVYNICERLREIDPSLFIIALTEGDKSAFVVMERCQDGVERLVAKFKKLDQRVLEKCERLKAIPFEQRFKVIEEQIDQEEQEQREAELDELYEKVGAPMLRDLERTNFIDPRSKAVYAPMSKIAMRHRAQEVKSRLKLD